MKRVLISLAGAGILALAATPAAAQLSPPAGGLVRGEGDSVRYSGRETIWSPNDVGIFATTPSRIESSRREMNRDRTTPYELRMTRRQIRAHAEDLLDRAEIYCDIADAEIVARTTENIPAIEVDCAQGGGLVIVDTLPIQATDCLDFEPVEGDRRDVGLQACRLPGNVAMVEAARQSARN